MLLLITLVNQKRIQKKDGPRKGPFFFIFKLIFIFVSQATFASAQDLRSKSTSTFLIGYQYISTWLPSKKTLSYTHILNSRWSIEAEYAWSTVSFPVMGIDLGKIKETRSTLQARRYLGESFHFMFGGLLNDLDARLGSDFLDRFDNPINSHLQIQNLGITLGAGNRFHWQNGLTLGVDWVRMNIPVYETKVKDNVIGEVTSSGEQEDLKKIIKTFNRVPTFVILGLSLGYTF